MYKLYDKSNLKRPLKLKDENAKSCSLVKMGKQTKKSKNKSEAKPFEEKNIQVWKPCSENERQGENGQKLKMEKVHVEQMHKLKYA